LYLHPAAILSFTTVIIIVVLCVLHLMQQQRLMQFIQSSVWHELESFVGIISVLKHRSNKEANKYVCNCLFYRKLFLLSMVLEKNYGYTDSPRCPAIKDCKILYYSMVKHWNVYRGLFSSISVLNCNISKSRWRRQQCSSKWLYGALK